MKRNFESWDPFSGNPRKKIKIKYTVKPPDHFFLQRTRNHMSKLNNECLNTFSNFINMEMVKDAQSIYTVLLADLILLKPSFFGEKFTGVFMNRELTQDVPGRDLVLNKEVRARVLSMLQSTSEADRREDYQEPWIVGTGPSYWTHTLAEAECSKHVKVNIETSRLRQNVHSFNGIFLASMGAEKIQSNADVQARTMQITKADGTKSSIMGGTRNINLNFFEALQICSILDHLSDRRRRKFLKHWSHVLVFLSNWNLAMELHCSVRTSTLCTYFSQLRVFLKWCQDPKNPREIYRHSLAHLLHDIACRKLFWQEMRAYLHTRTYSVHFRTVRASFTALGFFFRHLANITIWDAFPQLSETLKSLQKSFLDIEHSGSIALTLDEFQRFLDFILEEFECDEIDPAVLYNLCIYSFWAMLRRSEICNLLTFHMVPYQDKDTNKDKIRNTIMHAKTSSHTNPDQFVTIAEIPKHDLCPVDAFKRLQAARLEGCSFFVYTRKDKRITPSVLGRVFKRAATEWQTCDPLAPEGQLTFHSLRISAIGFSAIELGLSILEIQSISRHKFGSSVTKEIYIARSKQRLMDKVASKITDLVPISKTDPSAQNLPSWMDHLPLATRRVFACWK